MRTTVKILLFFILTSMTAASAGWRVAKKPVKLFGDAGREFVQPRWSPDGALIAFTEAGYQGLWIMKGDGTGARQISDEAAAGFGIEWAPNSKALVSRVAKYEKRFRYNAVKLFDLEKNEARLLTEYRTFMPGLPHWAAAGHQVYMFNRQNLEVFDTGIEAATLTKTAANTQTQFLKEDKIAIGDITTGAYRVLEPLQRQTCLNLTPSPQKTKVAFEILGGNMFVMNVDGTGLIDLGEGHRPQWSPDGDYLVYMITKDDGHQIQDSELFVIRWDGREKNQLTFTTDKLEMNPSWSSDGKSIAFDVMNDGAIYVLEISK
jgi:Tol biopolymer transport system component